MAFLNEQIKGGDCRLYYMNQGSYKKEPDWQSKADARLEKWLKQKKKDKRRTKQHGAFSLHRKLE